MNPILKFYYKLKNKITHAQYTFEGKCQRFRRGYSWTDVWNINDWFVIQIIPMLEHLIKHGIAFPIDFKCREEWEAILIEMIDGFKLYKTYECDAGIVIDRPTNPDDSTFHEMYDGDGESCYVDGAHCMTFQGKWYKMSMTKDEEKKFQHSLDLFNKHFYSLWD